MNKKPKIFIVGTGVIGFPMLVRCSDIKKKKNLFMMFMGMIEMLKK